MASAPEVRTPTHGPHYHEIDAIKALAIVGVLFEHMAFVGRFGPRTLALIGEIQPRLGWCVIAFFFTSGMTAHPARVWVQFRDFVAQRFRRLIVPCLAFSILDKAVLQGLFWAHIGSTRATLVWSPAGVVRFLVEPVGPQFYFLPYLFAVSVGVALAQLALSDRALVLLAAALLLGYGARVAIPPAGYGADFRLVPLYAYAYLLGCVLSPRRGDGWAAGAVVALVALALAFALTLQRALLLAAVPVALYFLLRRLKELSRAVAATRLGEWSSGIYVWHDPLLLPAVTILCARWIRGPLVLLPVLAITVFACVLLQRAVHRYPALRVLDF